MPGIFHRPFSRRTSLKYTAIAGAALMVQGVRVRAAEGNADDAFHLALLSDTHVPGDRMNGYRGFNPWENLKRIIPDVAASRPEGVIINGDAARLDGKPEDYRELKALLTPLAEEAPVYIGLGNHDHRPNFFNTFSDNPGVAGKVDDKHVTVIEHPNVRVVVLDSLLYVDKVAGLLGRGQRNWLQQYLPEHTDRPINLFVHHTLGDRDSDLLDTDRLFEILKPNPQVKAIFYGHSHSWNTTVRQGVQLINLPAVGYNFQDSEPVGWVGARFHRDGVEMTLHAFAGNRSGDGKTTRVQWL